MDPIIQSYIHVFVKAGFELNPAVRKKRKKVSLVLFYIYLCPARGSGSKGGFGPVKTGGAGSFPGTRHTAASWGSFVPTREFSKLTSVAMPAASVVAL